MLGHALHRFDLQFEDSIRILSAGNMTVISKIIMLLIRPSLMSVMVLIFNNYFGELDVLYVLSLPVNVDVLAILLYRTSGCASSVWVRCWPARSC